MRLVVVYERSVYALRDSARLCEHSQHVQQLSKLGTADRGLATSLATPTAHFRRRFTNVCRNDGTANRRVANKRSAGAVNTNATVLNISALIHVHERKFMDIGWNFHIFFWGGEVSLSVGGSGLHLIRSIAVSMPTIITKNQLDQFRRLASH